MQLLEAEPGREAPVAFAQHLAGDGGVAAGEPVHLEAEVVSLPRVPGVGAVEVELREAVVAGHGPSAEGALGEVRAQDGRDPVGGVGRAQAEHGTGGDGVDVERQ